MEIEEVETELHALRNLYALLQRSGTPEASAILLDESARMMLKDLLDRKSESVLKAYSEIITAQSNTSMPCSTQLVQTSPGPQPADPPSMVRRNNNADFCSRKTVPRKDDSWLTEQGPWEADLAPSTPDIPSKKSATPKRQCRFCQRNSMKQQALVLEGQESVAKKLMGGHVHRISSGHDSDDSSNWNRVKKINQPRQKKTPDTEHIAVDAGCDNKERFQTQVNKQEGEESDVLKNIVTAVKRIEAQMMVLQNLSRPSNPVKDTDSTDGFSMDDPVSQVGDYIPHPRELLPRQLSQREHKHDMSKPKCQIASNSHKPVAHNDMDLKKYLVVRDVKNLPRLDSPSSESTEVPARRSKQEALRQLVTWEGHRKGQNGNHASRVHAAATESAWKLIRSRPFIQEIQSSIASEESSNSTFLATSSSHRSRIRGRAVAKRFALQRDHRSRSYKMVNVRPRNSVRPRQVESNSDESVSSTSGYSYSSRMSPTTSGSEAYSSPVWSHTASDSSRNESIFEDSISSYSTRNPHKGADHPIRRGRSRRQRSRSSGPGNPDKGIGRLRKIKNKLGLIFHHHHHHHHHHGGEFSNSNNKGPYSSMWKHVREIFHREGRGLNEVKKTGNGGHSSEAADGLMRHEKHVGKKPRLPETKGAKTRAKRRKLHWWQLKRRVGAELPRAGHTKAKLLDKKPKPKATKLS